MDDVDMIVERNDFHDLNETISVSADEYKNEKYTVLIGCMKTEQGWIDLTAEEWK